MGKYDDMKMIRLPGDPVRSIYVIGSLRNPRVPEVANQLRDTGHDVFDDWWAASEDADDWWQKYEKARGRDFISALNGWAASHVYKYDRFHLERADAGVLVLPAGKSGHLELGFLMGRGKPGFILLDGEPDRFDVMYKFARGVYKTTTELIEGIDKWDKDERGMFRQ